MGKVIIIDDNPVYCDYAGNLFAKSGVPVENCIVFKPPRKPCSK